MTHWITATELAGMAGMPGTDRAIRIRAQKEQWQSRPRAKGKGVEYHIDSLPAETQTAVRISVGKKAANAARAALPATVDKTESLARYQRLKPHQRRKVDAIVTLLTELDIFVSASGLSKKDAYTAFATAWNNGEIDVSADVRSAQPTCSRASIYRWQKIKAEKGIADLAEDLGAARRGTGIIDSQPALKEYVVAMMVGYPHIKATTLAKACRAEFSGQPVTLPSDRRLSEWMNGWKSANKALFSAVTNPDEWKNKYMAAMGSASEHVIALNQLWEFDSTPADLMLTDGRHSLLGVIDVYSRRTLFVVMPTSNSKGVAQVIRRALLSWGVPEIAKTDNGADYKSHWIRHVFESLGIEQEFCPPFQGWKKPHIERVFRTFAHDIAELLDGFIGHNVAERKAIEARKAFSDRLFEKDRIIDVSMSSAELQQFCNDWLDHEYHTRTHSELKMSPLAKAGSYNGSIRSINNERLLDVLLSEPAKTRTVGKEGIKINGGEYIAPELAGIPGQEVKPYYDADDMGRIYVYNPDGEFICVAEDPTLTGLNREEVAARAKEIQKETIQEERRRLKAAAKRVTKRDVAAQILEERREATTAQVVRQFPRPDVPHTSPGLDAAQAALDSQNTDNSLPSWFKPGQVTETPAAPTPAAVVQLDVKRGLNPPENPFERYQYWLTVQSKIKEGEATEEEHEWYQRFEGSPAWRSGKMLADMRSNASGQ